MNPRVAVVIPSYNHERYVGLAIESVLNQTRKADRFLIIDDGSTDGSVEIIKSYAGRGVELIEQENANAFNTINRAVGKVVDEGADYVSILNSDDSYEPGRIARCLEWLEAHPGRDVVCSEVNFMDDDGNPLDEATARAKWFRAIWSLADQEDIEAEEWLGIANWPLTTTNVFARAAYIAANPMRPYHFNHDYFFLVTAALRGKLGHFPGKTVNYRVHGGNTINTEPGPLLKGMLRMQLDLYHCFAPELKADPEIRKRFYRYTRACWDNVSALHNGLFQCLLADLAEGIDLERIDEMVEALDESTFEELAAFPNRSLVNQHKDGRPLGIHSGLSDKYEELREQSKGLREDRNAFRELNALRSRVLRSRWLAFGRLLGAGKKLTADAGKSPAEKLTNLQAALEASLWVKLGRKFGVRFGRE